MLTKDLLKYTTRADKLFPKYLPAGDEASLKMAAEIGAIYGSGVGRSLQDLQDELKQGRQGQNIVFDGFCKLLDDRCEYLEQEESIEAQRWVWFAKAAELRRQGYANAESFQRDFAEQQGLEFSAVRAAIYGDLPDCRTLAGFKPLAPDALIHRYNAAQIQGLLLRAQRIQMTVRDEDILKRRRFLQKLKFWRLMAEFKEQNGELTVDVSGPLSIFESTTQTYGLRLCNFFPYLLLMNRWSLEAEIKLGEKVLSLKVDNSRPIASHYKDFTGHIPQEFKLLIASFNNLPENERKSWEAGESTEVLNLGRQSYCVPDISFRQPAKASYHLELFHKWHGSQLRQRLESLDKDSGKFLILGIAQELVKEGEMESLIASGRANGANLFTFRKFPTPKAILAYLS